MPYKCLQDETASPDSASYIPGNLCPPFLDPWKTQYLEGSMPEWNLSFHNRTSNIEWEARSQRVDPEAQHPTY